MSNLNPYDVINKVKSVANLEESESMIPSVVKVNKSGKLKFQIVAPNVNCLFRPRVQHFIQTLPDSDDPNESIIYAECSKNNCPICAAVDTFKNCDITPEDINAAYSLKYPIKKVKSFFTSSEHYLLCIKVLSDQADDGYYLPKDEELGSFQILQLSRTALNSLMASYQDYIEDASDSGINVNSGDYSLFGLLDDDNDPIKSLVVSLRVQTNGQWQYIFSFNSSASIDKNSIDQDKIKFIQEIPEYPDDYLQKAINQINKIKNYFIDKSEIASGISKPKNDTKITKDKEPLGDPSNSFSLEDLDLESL